MVLVLYEAEEGGGQNWAPFINHKALKSHLIHEKEMKSTRPTEPKMKGRKFPYIQSSGHLCKMKTLNMTHIQWKDENLHYQYM